MLLFFQLAHHAIAPCVDSHPNTRILELEGELARVTKERDSIATAKLRSDKSLQEARSKVEELKEIVAARDDMILRNQVRHERALKAEEQAKAELAEVRREFEEVRTHLTTRVEESAAQLARVEAKAQEQLDSFQDTLEDEIEKYVLSLPCRRIFMHLNLGVVRQYTKLLASKFPSREKEILHAGNIFMEEHFDLWETLPSEDDDVDLPRARALRAWWPDCEIKPDVQPPLVVDGRPENTGLEQPAITASPQPVETEPTRVASPTLASLLPPSGDQPDPHV